MIEVSLTLLATLFLVIGTIDICQCFMHVQYMNARARATARWAATHWDPSTQTPDAVKNYAVYGSAAVPDGRATGTMGLSPNDVTVNVAGTAGTMSHRVTVSITKQLNLFTPGAARALRPRPSVATSPMESMGGTGN